MLAQILFTLLSNQLNSIIFLLKSLLQGRQTFSIKGQIINILGLRVNTVFVDITQLCRCNAKAARDNT